MGRGALETPIYLYHGDVVLVNYELRPVPDDRKTIEDYIQSLPLADNRDPIAQKYPLKNWNVHLIEEDDPLFSVVVKDRHPFHDPITYGKVRTTFLYSEKVYNMDTFDGSLRDSQVPCDIDKDFLDPCSYCQSSKFNVDLEIENLSSDRIEEAKSIIEEYSPFDALLNKMSISGVINDFVVSPLETIEQLVHVIREDAVMSQKPNEYRDIVMQEESISYDITYADGSKEHGKI